MPGLRPCITFGAQRPDDAVAAELWRLVEPLALEAIVMATRQIQEREDERRRTRALECEQARYEVPLAARRYEAVDPDYRLVAGEREARWNAAIVRFHDCEHRVESLASEPRLDPDVPALERLAHDLPAVWSAASTDMGVKQRLLRTLVEEIVVDVDEPHREVVLVIHWTGGPHSALRVRKPGSGEHRNRAPAAADQVIRAMASTWSDEQIAATLNRMGLRTGQAQTWTARRVASYRRKAGIAAYAPAAEPQEWVTMRDAAKHTGVTSHVIRALIQRGLLPAKPVVPDAPWQIRVADLATDAVRAVIAHRHSIRRPRRVRADDRTFAIPGT